MATKWVYMFKEGNATMRNLLGGKGANLAEMTSLGLPVPQGFTVTTEACTQYYEDGRQINDEIMSQIMEAMTKLEEIVYIADYIEPYRNHAQNLDTIRQLAFMDLERAIYQVTKDTLAYLEKKGGSIDPATVQTYEYYQNLAKKGDK